MPDDKKSHKLPITPKTDPQRETRVLMEEVRADFKTVSEQYGSITKKLQEHDQKFDKLDGRLDRVEEKLIQHDHRFNQIENQLGHLQDQVTSILTDHEHRLKTVEQKLEIT